MIEPNTGFRPVMQDDGWRQSWRAIVSGRFEDAPHDALLFYDPPGGTVEVYGTDGLGHIALLRTTTGWSTTWSHVVPGWYAHGRSAGVLFYDRANGLGEFHVSDGQGNLALLRAHDGWRTSWDRVLPVADQNGLTRLVFYDRDAGHGEVYSTDGAGGIALQRAHDGWRTSWSEIIPLQIGRGTFLLFYEGSGGYAELYTLDAAGEIRLVQTYTGWRSSWSIIQPLVLRSTSSTGLVFYDRGAGDAELYTIDAPGELARVKTFSGWRRSWALMTPGSFGGVFGDLLLYDRDAGEGEIVSLDSWPLAPLEGYLSREGVRPNEAFTVHVRSAVGPFRVQLLRRGLTDAVIAHVGIFADVPVDIPLDASENGCRWPAATEVAVPAGTPSGLFVVRLSTLDGAVTAEIPFVVIAEDPGAATGILFAIPSSTYEAYAWWGGRSLYGHGEMRGFQWADPRGFQVSPHRPYLGPDDFVKPKFQCWELPFIQWLERNGIVVEFCTSNELHADPDLLSRYSLIVSVGHDEYWSREMRDNVEQFAGNGGIVVVLSGNSVWWQVRFGDPPAITCYKDAQLDPANSDPATRPVVTVNWIDPLLGRPETLLTGVSFQYGTLIYGNGVSPAPEFEVVAPDAILADTGLGIGGRFGTYTDPAGRRPPWQDGWRTVIGYECDGRPTPGSGATPDGETDPPRPDWRTSWDSILADPGTGGGLLFYDRTLGEAELHRLDGSGTLSLLKFHQGWRGSWDAIVRGAFGGTASGGLLFYDRSAGVGEFYALTAGGEIALLQTQDFWRQSWDLIVPGQFGGDGHTDLLLYDRAAGQGEFYATDAAGNITLLQTHEGWRQSWDLILPGNFGGSGQTDLLFYDRSDGTGEFYSVDAGRIGLLQTQTGWRGSWDIILPLELGLPRTALLFYDRGGGTGEIYATDGAGNIALLKTHGDWRTTWMAIVPLRVDGHGACLLFYETDTGYAELYAVSSTGDITFIRSYDRAFTLIARSVFPQPSDDPNATPREYASLGRLRIGSGQVFSVGTTDWSFGLSQDPEAWTPVDQITANLLHLDGTQRLVRPLAAPPARVSSVAPASADTGQSWEILRGREGVRRRE